MNIAASIGALNGKCYALMDLVFPINYAAAQMLCFLGTGLGHSGRLATFADCAEYAAVKSQLTPRNTNRMFIGLKNASTLPKWAKWDDPQQLCQPEYFNTSDWTSGYCNGSLWNPGPQSCIAVNANFGNWDGIACNSSTTAILCEFGKLGNFW